MYQKKLSAQNPTIKSAQSYASTEKERFITSQDIPHKEMRGLGIKMRHLVATGIAHSAFTRIIRLKSEHASFNMQR